MINFDMMAVQIGIFAAGIIAILGALRVYTPKIVSMVREIFAPISESLHSYKTALMRVEILTLITSHTMDEAKTAGIYSEIHRKYHEYRAHGGNSYVKRMFHDWNTDGINPDKYEEEN